MRGAILLNLALLSVAATLAPAETRLVPTDYTTIQQAINDSNDGDVVIVDPGIYLENINFLGKNIIVTSTNPDNPEIVAATIIDGNDQGSVVTFANKETSAAVLTGFTITGGYGTANTPIPEENYLFWGAGIYCRSASPTITCNVITGNNGPVEMERDNPQQQVSYGGGIGCNGSGAIITRNIIKNNSAYGGGGIMASGGDVKISNNLIYDNSAVVGGGVIISEGCLINNTIVSNDASLRGGEGGMAGNLYSTCNPEFDEIFILNNIICNAKSGSGIFLLGIWDESSFAFNNVWGNLPGNYVQIDMNTGQRTFDGSADRAGLGGNMSQDPLLQDGYHIGADSPCCDAGDPNYVAYPWQRDIDGEYAVMGARVDIGADEVTANARPVADAGDDQCFDTIIAYVTLNGTGSYDLDSSDSISYQWQQISGSNVSLVNPDTAEPNFAPAIEDVYVFELTVTDGKNNSAPDSIMIVVGNRAPVADAGNDQICEPGQQVMLDGSESYDPDEEDVISYSWSQISGPSVELLDPNTPSARFTPNVEGEYVFELIVNDGTDQSLPDTVTVTCRIGSEPDAYGYRWVDSGNAWGPKYHWINIKETGTRITGLDYSFEECVGPFPLGFDFDFYGNNYNQFYVQSNGLISFGPEPIVYDNQPIPAADGYDNIIAWMWTYMYPSDASKIYYQQFDRFTVIQFIDYDIGFGGSVNAEVIIYKSGRIVIQYKDFSDDAYLYSYTVGIENADGTIGTQVAFNDPGYLHSELVIEFSLGPPYEPVADAGPDRYLDGIELVTLDGTGSYDRDPNDVLTYQWTQIAGPAVQLSDSTAVQPTFMPEFEGEYWFQLVVSDGATISEPDEVLIVVGNRPPIANAGSNKVVQVPGRVSLDGTGSYDLDLDDELIYLWTQVEGPQIVLQDANTATPYFDCAEEGFYVFELVVSDGLVESEPSMVRVATVFVTVNQLDLNVGYSTDNYFHYPDISGTKVVYGVGSACDYTWDIKCRYLETNNVVSFTGGGIDTQPKIDGDIVVWFGGPRFQSPWGHEPSNTSVFVRNLATAWQRTLRAYTMSESYSHPVVSGNKVVWLEHLGLDTVPIGSSDANNWWNTPYSVCGADITDLDNPVYFTIAENVGTRDPYPCHSYSTDFDDVIDISGNIVVYEAGGNIYGADISNLEAIKVFTICSHPARQFDPAISGNLVVWTDERNDAGDIYGADISDMEDIRELEIVKAPSSQQQPAIDGYMIVYVEGNTSGGQIKACCLTRQYGVLDIPLIGAPYGIGPAIDGNIIVWQTEAYGQPRGISLDFAYSTIDGPVKNLTTGKYYDYIQHAINNAVSGDEIAVSPGIYYENIEFKGKNPTVRSIDPNDSAVVAATIINGRHRESVVTFSHVVDANCLLAGFTVTGGKTGIYCVRSNPTITKCTITDNFGAGIKLWDQSNPTVTNCIIAANAGAGIEMWPEPAMRIIWHNYATITNCTIAMNIQQGIWGGRPTIRNSIIYFNGSESNGVQIESDSTTVTYSNIQGSWTGEGNFDDDPFFIDSANGDYHLKSQTGRWDSESQSWIQDDVTSPCIDAGDPDSDWTAEPSPNGERVNIGAYGGTVEASMSL